MRIPRTLHLIWLGPPLPGDLSELVDTFTYHHPHWEVVWWGEEEIEAFGLANAEAYRDAPDLVPADAVHQMRSDIARLEILSRHGGMYADCDYRWQQAIDPHLQGHDLVTCWEEDGLFVANGVIAATPGHPAMGEAIAEVPRRVLYRKDWWRANRLTGPHLWTPVAMRHAHILPSSVLHPAPHTHPEWAVERDYPDAVAVHYWNHQRTLRGI